MNRMVWLVLLIFSLMACDNNDPAASDENTTNNSSSNEEVIAEVPVVSSDATYTVIEDLDVTFAEGLAHDATSTAPFAVPLKLDVYYPDTTNGNRPVYMFIHGGGFKGGTKTKPEIVEMANFYASRGWVFASIDYRTTEELCDVEDMPPCQDKLRAMAENGPDELVDFYKGIVPQEWMSYILEQELSSFKELQQGIAQYAAQRDAKAALRWLVAHASTYAINTEYITVGGASAGAITTVALGISNPDDFRDEIAIDDDSTLSTTNLEENYNIKSIVYFWGSNIKLDLFEAVYGLEQYDRYDSNDPELFMGHGQAEDPVTPYAEALELQDIYDSLGVYNELKTLLLPNGNPAGHGAWNAEVDGKGLSELTFDFLTQRQKLIVQ